MACLSRYSKMGTACIPYRHRTVNPHQQLAALRRSGYGRNTQRAESNWRAVKSVILSHMGGATESPHRRLVICLANALMIAEINRQFPQQYQTCGNTVLNTFITLRSALLSTFYLCITQVCAYPEITFNQPHSCAPFRFSGSLLFLSKVCA